MLQKTYSLKLYLVHKPVIIMIALSAVFNLLAWGVILFQVTPSSEPVFLSYNILFGVDKIGPWWKLLYIPLFGMIVSVINSILGWLTFHKDSLYAYVFLGTSVLVQLCVCIATWILVVLNV